MSVSYPCKSCEKFIRESENSLQCDSCVTWIHLKCSHLNFTDYKKFQNQSKTCFCCNCRIFPFGKLNNQQFYKFLPHEKNLDHSITIEKNIGFLVLINAPQNLSLLLNQFSCLSDETNLHDVDKINNCKYYDAEQVQTLKIPKNYFKMFHINACSLGHV